MFENFESLLYYPETAKFSLCRKVRKRRVHNRITDKIESVLITQYHMQVDVGDETYYHPLLRVCALKLKKNGILNIIHERNRSSVGRAPAF